MNRHDLNERIDALFRRGAWAEARKLLEREQEREPENHWLLTQRGVTLYEQKRYEEALKLFLASLEIVANCPLTLWNLAGTLDALGDPSGALRIYTWLLESKVSPQTDSCWESETWAEALKADSVFRLGVCLQHLGKKRKAERCYRQYINLVLSGVEGSYSLDEVGQHIQELHLPARGVATGGELRKAVNEALQIAGVKPGKGRRKRPPTFDETERRIGRVSGKK